MPGEWEGTARPSPGPFGTKSSLLQGVSLGCHFEGVKAHGSDPFHSLTLDELMSELCPHSLDRETDLVIELSAWHGHYLSFSPQNKYFL